MSDSSRSINKWVCSPEVGQDLFHGVLHSVSYLFPCLLFQMWGASVEIEATFPAVEGAFLEQGQRAEAQEHAQDALSFGKYLCLDFSGTSSECGG